MLGPATPRQRESLIVLELGAVFTVMIVLIGRGRRRGVCRLDMRGILELRPRRQSVDLDDAGIAHIVLYAEGVAHRAGDDLQLLLILIGERDQHHEEADQEAHEIGEGDKLAVAAAVCFLAPRHGLGLRAQAGTGSGSTSRCFSGR
jgi:hypothetical protein